MTIKYRPLACGFHSHTDLSLDGGSTVETKLKHAASLGRIADCCTDHGVMSALAPHWMAAEKLAKDKNNPIKIKSIHGVEAYIIDPHRPPKVAKNGKKEPHYMHLTIHFKTSEAYQYFCRLTPKMEERALVKFGERKPLMLLEELEPIAGQITIGSGCLVGPVMKNVLQGRSDWARENYIRLRNIAGSGNFFSELFPHRIDKNWKAPVYEKVIVGAKEQLKLVKEGEFVNITTTRMDKDAVDVAPEIDPCTGSIDIQKRPNEFVMQLAKEFNDPIIISLDDHYGPESDQLVQEVRIGNSLEKWRFYGSYAQHSSEHCAEQLIEQLGVEPKDISEWIDNSYKFVELFDNYKMDTNKDRWLLPTTEMVYGDIQQSNKDKLRSLIEKHGKMPSLEHPQYQVYKDRLEYEIDVLADNGTADFLPYFFVLEDACNYARENDILWNIRGSGGGCLVVYLLNISITDPIIFNLPFERFLTLGRIKSGTLPDLDSDWEDRDLIIDYLRKKYGNKITLIATDMMMRVKTSILDCERAILGEVRPATHDMCKKLKGASQGMTDKEWLYGFVDKTTGERHEGFIESDNPDAQTLRNYATDNAKIWEAVQKCIGITKTRGVHAGGLIITPAPVEDFFPLIKTKQGLSAAYNMKQVEYVGGVKYDFLGVETLRAISISRKALREDGKADLKWDIFPHDPEVYTNIIHKGNLAGIFQISTHLVAPYVKEIKPRSVVDISTLTALIRPGALDAPSPDPKDDPKETAAKYFVKCAQNLRKPYFIHKDMESIAGHTHGILVFQEQTLQIFRDIGGYSFEEAEAVRRGIGKKDRELLGKHSAILKQKCLERGWTEAQANTLFQSIQASANYSFNCLAGDQEVITDRGLVSMEELIKNFNDYRVLSQNLDGSLSYEPVSLGMMTGYKEVYEIELSDGSIIKATEDHMFKSNNEWLTLKEIIEQGRSFDQIEQ